MRTNRVFYLHTKFFVCAQITLSTNLASGRAFFVSLFLTTLFLRGFFLPWQAPKNEQEQERESRRMLAWCTDDGSKKEGVAAALCSCALMRMLSAALSPCSLLLSAAFCSCALILILSELSHNMPSELVSPLLVPCILEIAVNKYPFHPCGHTDRQTDTERQTDGWVLVQGWCLCHLSNLEPSPPNFSLAALGGRSHVGLGEWDRCQLCTNRL